MTYQVLPSDPKLCGECQTWVRLQQLAETWHTASWRTKRGNVKGYFEHLCRIFSAVQIKGLSTHSRQCTPHRHPTRQPQTAMAMSRANRRHCALTANRCSASTRSRRNLASCLTTNRTEGTPNGGTTNTKTTSQEVRIHKDVFNWLL